MKFNPAAIMAVNATATLETLLSHLANQTYYFIQTVYFAQSDGSSEAPIVSPISWALKWITSGFDFAVVAGAVGICAAELAEAESTGDEPGRDCGGNRRLENFDAGKVVVLEMVWPARGGIGGVGLAADSPVTEVPSVLSNTLSLTHKNSSKSSFVFLINFRSTNGTKN